jgi:hypothetical protein
MRLRNPDSLGQGLLTQTALQSDLTKARAEQLAGRRFVF